MQKAKESVQAFVAKAGHHDTTVHESIAPAVQHETVKPLQHEEVTTATDREVHQDHYHHTVQPVKDREVLPEQHQHKMADVEHREFDHRDHDSTKQKLASVQAGFKDHQSVQDTKYTQSAAPAVGGEHVHHHIHETIQPVVHKETIQPNVVHTTVPIHEVHHNAATHHNTTELPALSMSEFKNKGGSLHGREEKYDGFEGEPKHVGGVLGTGHSSHSHGTHEHGSHHTTGTGAGLPGSTGHTDRSGMTGNTHNTGHTGGAVKGDGIGRRAEEAALGSRTGNVPGQTHTGTHGTHGTHGTTGTTGTTGTHGMHDTTGNTTAAKPSMLDKLNPFKDTDGDGKKGVME